MDDKAKLDFDKILYFIQTGLTVLQLLTICMEIGFEETWKIEVKIVNRVLSIAFVLGHLPNV